MSDPTTPLEIAELLARCGTEVYRDRISGLYVLDATVPPTLLTLWQYESGMRVLAIREKAATDARR